MFVPDLHWAHPASYSVISGGKSGRNVNITSRLHLMSAFRMGGPILLLPFVFLYSGQRKTIYFFTNVSSFCVFLYFSLEMFMAKVKEQSIANPNVRFWLKF